MIITEGDAVTLRPFENPISCFKQDELDSWMLCCHPVWINVVWVMPQITRGINRIGYLVGEITSLSLLAHVAGWVSLEVLAGLVLWFSGGEVVFQEALEVLEGRPLFGLLAPAGQHELVKGVRTLGGTGHPVPSLHLVQHLPVHHT